MVLDLGAGVFQRRNRLPDLTFILDSFHRAFHQRGRGALSARLHAVHHDRFQLARVRDTCNIGRFRIRWQGRPSQQHDLWLKRLGQFKGDGGRDTPRASRQKDHRVAVEA